MHGIFRTLTASLKVHCMSTIAYLRVSTGDQSTENQLLQIRTAGYIPDRTFEDTFSGSTMERSGFKAMLEYLRDGDTLVVSAIDRLGRNTIGVLETVETLKARGVRVVSLRESFDLTTPIGQMMLTMMAAMAQMEKSLIAERRDAGMARARSKGTHMGRPRETPVNDIREALQRLQGNVSAVSKELGCSRQTVMRAR
jgi:putative DNA-invertase from lambdoid prophage Rac